MLTVRLTNKIQKDDPFWKKPYKIKSRTINIETLQDSLKEIEKDFLNNYYIIMIPKNGNCDAENPKPGDKYNVFLGVNYKFIGEVTVKKCETEFNLELS